MGADPKAVWEFIADPANRARAISVVDRYDVDGERATWYIRLPIPMVRTNFRVKTRNVERTPPEYVKFQGNSSVFDVLGEHRVTDSNGSTTITNTFTVDGHVPGVEAFFKHNLDEEISNLETALREHLDEQ